jgi:uncharacterized membrane protein YbhN (UPF0104 family)
MKGILDVMSPREPHRLRTWAARLLRLAIALILIIWVLWNLDWAALADNLRQAHLGWIVLAAASFTASLLLKVVRWRWLLTELAPDVTWLHLARAYFLGQAANLIGFGRLGEVARVLSLRREGKVSGLGTASSVVAEKLLDLSFLALAGVWWLAFFLSPPEGVDISSILLVGAASVAAFVMLGWRGQALMDEFQRRLTPATNPIGKWLAPRAAALSSGLAGLTRRRLLGRGLLVTAAIWTNMLVTNILLLLAFDLPPSFRLALSVLVVGLLGVVAHLTPANIGPAHWAATLALTLFDVPHSTALAYAIVLHAILTAVPLLAALLLNNWPGSRLPSRWSGYAGPRARLEHSGE